MTLEAFRAEVLRHLPALASWEFRDTHGCVECRAPTPKGDITTGLIWLYPNKDEVRWNIATVGSKGGKANTLPAAIADFRQRNAAAIKTLADLTVDP